MDDARWKKRKEKLSCESSHDRDAWFFHRYAASAYAYRYTRSSNIPCSTTMFESLITKLERLNGHQSERESLWKSVRRHVNNCIAKRNCITLYKLTHERWKHKYPKTFERECIHFFFFFIPFRAIFQPPLFRVATIFKSKPILPIKLNRRKYWLR